MHEWPEKLKKDIINVRNKVKDSRMHLTGGVVENKAKEAGKSVSEFSKDTYKSLDQSLEELTVDLSGGAYKVTDKLGHEIDELTETIKKIHKDVKAKRREITGGYIEDKTKETLDSVDRRLEKLINKMKE